MADEKPKYTPEGLPVVNEEVYKVFLRDLETDTGHITQDIVKNIIDTNGCIALNIADAVLCYPESYRNRVTGHLCSLYELLRRQADVNKMGELYK